MKHLIKEALERFFSKIEFYVFICIIFWTNDEFQFVAHILTLVSSMHRSNMLPIFNFFNDVKIITMEFSYVGNYNKYK